MAPKRKKKDAGGKSSEAAAAAKRKDDDDDDKDPLATVLINIQQISKQKNRCTELLQALNDESCTVLHEHDNPNSKTDHVDCYWILLATHTIQRLVDHLETHQADSVTILLAALSHALAMALYSDKNKLEKCAGKTGVVRSALGRAIMSITIGSTSALQNLENVTDDVSPSLIRRAAWSALTALEIVVNHSAPKSSTASSSTNSDGWNHAQYWLLQDAASLDVQQEEELMDICQDASSLLGITKEEHACLEALVGTEDGQAPPTPSKRRRAARKDNDVPASAIAATFKSLMTSPVSSIMIDGRVSVRRWSSMTFVWFCKGQQRLLEFVDNLLTNNEYWDSVLDYPAVIGLKDAPPPKKPSASSKKSSRSKRSAPAEPVQASPPVHIPGNVSTVALASRLIALVSDTGSTCGIRAPTGGMDTYAAHVLGLVGNSGKGRGRAAAAATAAESIPAWKRPDVRNLASVVIYKLVQVHTACLRKNCTSPEAFGCVLVNDDSSTGFAASVPMGAARPLSARFYPLVFKSLKSLCFAAASSGDDSTNVSDSTKRLLGIASAFILASGEQIRNIVDAKLYGVAISQLSDCLRSITSDDDRTNGPRSMDVDKNEDEEARHSRLVEEYNLIEPIPTPSLPSTKASRKRKKKKSDNTQESSICTFGGMFPQDTSTGQQKNMSDEELLSFLIRAVQASSDESPPSALFTELIEIVRCCYDLKEPSFETSPEDADGGSKRKGRKRGASSKASQGKRKRKKVSTDAAEVSQADEKAGQRRPKNIMSPRATLATDSLNVLRMMVSHIPQTSSAPRSRRELREFLRETLTTEQICSVVDLNRMINEALIESHVAMKAAQKTSVGEDASSSFFSASLSGSFRPYEKLLWSAHIKLCETIGQGQSIYDSSKRGLLGDSNQRLAVFRALAVSSKRKVPVSNASKSKSSPERWPLSLPPAQHALVISSLTSNPIQGQDDFGPERFITRSFMSSITDALDDPSVLKVAEWHKSSLDFVGSESVVADDDVPLSLRYARLFVLAVTRLPCNEQMEFLKSFVGAVSSAVCKLKSSAPHCALFKEDANVSGFLARVVTTCASLVNLVTVGSPLRNVLVAQVYPSHYAIPTLVAVDDMNPLEGRKEFNWYRKDSSFVSLFSDWESPVVPNVTGLVNMNIEVSDELVSNLRTLHESSIQLGFASAKADRCHLLFAAWNASGRQASWDKKSVSPKVNASAADEASATCRLLELREDICSLNRELHGNESLFPNSLLTRILKERSNGRSAPGQLKSKLESMMAKAEAIVDSILSSHSSPERQNDPPLVSFALLEALPTYIAFIMAAHTRSNESILVRESGRANNVYDEESVSSTEEYADERVDTLMRLNEACDAFGAAPLQPDWLDDGCSLRDGIAADDATRLAHRAMKCLEKLLSAAREEYIKSSSQALSSSIVTETNCQQRVDVALKLQLCLSRIDANTSDDASTSEGEATSISVRRDESIASLCGLETWQVKLLSDESNCTNFSHAIESFCQHAVQTIVGGMHTRHESFEGWDPSPAEYRVCGDWEYLLSEALLGACCNAEFPEESPPSNDFRQGFHTAIRWARIQQACTTHLMPVAALLRFGLSDGKGRQRHPLLNPVIDGGEEIKISSAMNLCDPLPESTSRSSRSQVNDSIMRTLSALSLVPCNDLSDFTRRACAAVASNVVIDSKAFSRLESMEALRLVFETIGEVRELVDSLDDNAKDRALSGSFVSEQLMCAVVKCGTLVDEQTPRRLEELYSFLGGRPFILDTIVTTGTDYASIFQDKRSGRNLRQIQDLAVANLIGVLSGDDVALGTWSLVAEILGGLAGWEKSCGGPTQASSLSPRLVKALNGKDVSYFQKLAEWIVYKPPIDIRPEDDTTLQKISSDLCSFVTFAVGAARPVGRKQAVDFKGARIIFDILIESADEWLWLEPRVSNDVMSLLCVLGARYNTLHTIGSRLLSIMKKGTDDGEEKEYAVPIERFFRFLRDLDSALSASSETNMTLSSKLDHETENADAFRSSAEDGQPVVYDSSANTVPDACSYVRKSGFHQQYWYNCYTCNLVWDKGCCTLCALRCHQDHDVSYSRYSSFFCDCGGEAPTEVENRVPCKCLTSIDSHEAETIFEGQRWSTIDQFPEVSESKSDTSSDSGSDDELYTLAIAVASSALEQQSRSSLEKLKEQAETQSWTKDLFEALGKSQNRWQLKSTEQVVSPETADAVMSSPARSVKDQSVVPSARGRRGKVLKLRKLDRKALLPIRGVRSGTFKLSLSNDSTSDRVKRATLAKHGVRRQAIVIDSRGRIIVTEPCSLLFCSALPPINVRYEDKSSELPFGRGQMSVLGSTPMSFGIVGMELCRDNERHLLAWGTGEASVLILAKSCHKAERKIELRFDLESDEVDFVIKCKWIPGSQTMVAVICGLSVKIFDIRQAQGDKVTSVVSYTLAYEALLRDAALAPTSGTTMSSAENEATGARAVSETVKLYLLLDIGQVLDLVLRFDENGLQEQGDMYIESGEGMPLPVGGVRVNPPSQPASTGSMTRSLGEGSSLTYLPESGVLLYACTSSPVLALLLDDRGNVSGSFELLPYIIKGEVLGTGSDGYSIHGPYTRFTELGYVEYDGIKYFRIVCVGKSSRTTQAKILCVDYNQNAVRVKEIAWTGPAGIPGMSMTSAFDGLAAFSAPVFKTAMDTNAHFKQSDFIERAFLCAIASSGAMALFGEEIADISPLPLTATGASDKKPSFPLTLFEKLVNVSESETLVFAGDRIGSSSDPDGAKVKLSPNNSSYFMCPSREGCTITVSLKDVNAVALGRIESAANQDMLAEHSLSKSVKDQLVIVALRLLVGSTTTEFIPKYVSVEGRRVWLQPDLKKHYDLPLTAEEIASALRNGFVTLGIGPSFDSGNNPLLDSVEVYAARREQISHWLPLTLSQMRKGLATGGEDAMATETAEQSETPAEEKRLALSMTSITHILQVLRTSSALSPEANETIRQVIQATALKDGGALRQSLTTMLSCIEPDPCRQKMLLDEGVLAGLLKDLRRANEILASTAADRWNQVREIMKDCLRVAAGVAGERPGNYKSVVESLLQKETEDFSLAVTAASIVGTGLEDGFEWQDLVPELVELSLTESLLFPGRNEGPKETFASFDVLAGLLSSSDNEIVNECCKSILDYWVQNLSRPTEPVVSYQCDACSLFPIKGVRYTFPDGGSPPGQETDIDLCSDCFCIGRDYAAQHHYDSGVNVKIKGKTIGKSTKLSCACLGKMKRIAIPASWLVDADVAASQDSPTTNDSHSASTELENFSSVLFIDLVGLLSDRLERENLDFPLVAFQSLVDLVLDLVSNTNDESIMLSRAKEFAESLLTHIPRLIGLISTDNVFEEASRSVLIICMKGLASLAAIKNDLSGRSSMANNLEECSVEDTTPTKSKDKTDPRFVCEVHGVPAVRRRCSHGEHKNRRFYVCGMDRTCRCGYFQWADTADGERLTAASEEANCTYSDEIGRFIWGLLNKIDDEDNTQATCVLLRELIELDMVSLSDEDCTDIVRTGSTEQEKTRTCSLPSRYDRRAAALDYVDGVFCARQKLKFSTAQDLLDDSSRDDDSADPDKDTLFTIALDLLSYVADASLDESEEENEREPSGWLPLLCEVSSTSKSPRYRALAKRALKRFCGGRREVYQSIRDHFVFAFQFRKLLRAVQPALQAGLNVKEQARQCGMNWRTGRKATFASLPVGGLIGTSDLISEDCVTVSRGKTIGSTLDQLLSIAKNRGKNWRNFCGLETLPSQSTKKKATSSGDGATDIDIDSALLNISPAISLFWISSVLSSKSQIKVLRLVDIALSTQPPRKLSGSALESSTQNSDGRVEAGTAKSKEILISFCTPSSLPEDILLEGDKALLADEVHAYAVQFVVAGNSAELRKGAGKVVRKLCEKFEDDDFEWLFSQLANRAFSGLPELGTSCNELLRLLQTLAASEVNRISYSPLLSISRNVVDVFTSQLRLMSNGKTTELLAVQTQAEKVPKAPSVEDYDFTSCIHCQRTPNVHETSNTTRQQQNESSLDTQINRASRSTSTLAAPVQDSAMLPEQIRPFSRESLDDSTDATLSTEFSTYVQLKCRLAVSDIHVSIGDPRGRYVKTIAVYFSPRHVSDENVLKSDGYADKWQRCATISLPRGATRASCSITPPIIAANLRIQYEEFYERPGGSRAEDGSPLLHCPRCTRVVSNAHGVCGHCGEVAFQCRKCRHINYLSLDAFLCVECGYCSTASFSYELTCGAASNAVAVMDDDSYQRSIKVLQVATKLREELRGALNDRLRPSSGKRSLSIQKYGPSLKRTFLGELPQIRKEKKESVNPSSSTGRDESPASTASNRARSLLRLARQLRGDSSSDRSRVGDLLMRQSLLGATGGRGISIDDMEELDSDVVGFLSGDVEGGSDPLSRLVASIQGRQSSRSSGARDASSGGDGANPSRSGASGTDNAQEGTGEPTEASSKATTEECNRLYQLMREAERECYELRRRINAWKRLENDALADLGTAETAQSSFSPSECSSCGGPLAQQVLSFFMALFESNAEVVQSTITQNFVQALFDESIPMHRGLFDAKRAAIVALATKSEIASKLILEQLRLRLKGSRDSASGEIMGKIIAIDSPLGEGFVELAEEILASGY